MGGSRPTGASWNIPCWGRLDLNAGEMLGAFKVFSAQDEDAIHAKLTRSLGVFNAPLDEVAATPNPEHGAGELRLQVTQE